MEMRQLTPDQRRAVVEELVTENPEKWSQVALHRELGVSRRTIQKDLEHIERQKRSQGCYPSEQGFSDLSKGGPSPLYMASSESATPFARLPVSDLWDVVEREPIKRRGGDGPCACAKWCPLVHLETSEWRAGWRVPGYGRGEPWCPTHGPRIRSERRESIYLNSPTEIWWGWIENRTYYNSVVDYAGKNGISSARVIRVDDLWLVVAEKNLAKNKRRQSDGSRGYLMQPAPIVPILDGFERRQEEQEMVRLYNAGGDYKEEKRKKPPLKHRLVGKKSWPRDFMETVQTELGIRWGDVLTTEQEEQIEKLLEKETKK
jgi:hypothetical protein